MFRVRVITASERGNPKEIVTLCTSKSEAARRKTFYKERYPEADIFIDEMTEEKK